MNYHTDHMPARYRNGGHRRQPGYDIEPEPAECSCGAATEFDAWGDVVCEASGELPEDCEGGDDR